MPDVARPHRTRPVEVLITEPLTTANRGEIARWLEDQGIGVGVPAAVADVLPEPAIVVETRRDGERAALWGERLVVSGPDVDVVDQAHYKLWYEPVGSTTERTEP